MAAINFPASPSPGDKHPTTGSINGKVWAWDGTSWNIVSTDGSVTIIDDTARSFAFDVTYTNVAGNYNVVGTDRNGEVNGLNPTITVNEEDTLIFNVNATGHPFYLVWAHGGSSDQVGGGQGVNTASNQGTVNGTVTWVTDVGDGVALPQGGLFYYQCGNHPSMYGTIKVLLKKTSDGATHVHEFIDLDDTPNSYSGQDGKYIKVKSTEDGLEFTNAPSGGSSLSNIADAVYGVDITGKAALTDGIDIDIGGSINAAGTTIDFQNTTISFSGASFGGLQGTINGWVDTHLNQTGPTDGNVLSWDTSANGGNGDYAWVPQSGGGTASSDPIGTIVMWSGAANAIPTGYQLCDGSASATTELQAIRANVPDLRDKFVIGAGDTYNPDATGGSADTTLPEHSHQISAYNSSDVNGTGIAGKGYQQSLGSITTNDAGTGDGTGTNLPPYYALCYIIKNAATAGGGSDGNDYVTGAALGTGADAKVLTLSFGDTSLNKTVDLSSIDTDTTYEIKALSNNNDFNIQIDASGSGTDSSVRFETGDNITLGYINAGHVKISATDTTYSNFTTSSSGLVPVSPGGTSKYLRADGTWQEVSGGGGGSADGNDYITSAQLGTGANSKVLTFGFTDTSLNFNVDLASIDTDTDTTYNVVSINAAGLAPQLPLSSSGKYLKDDGTWDTPPDTDTNTTYSNFTTSASGLVPVSPGGTTKYLRADGTWQTITSGGNDGNDYVTNLSLDGTTLKAEFATSSLDQEVDLASINTDTTYGVVSNSVDGLAPQLPSSPSGKFLRDDATWQTPPDTDTNTNYYANDFQFNSSTNVLSIGYAGNSSLDTTVTINPSGGGDIPSGTAMLFAQGSAPTGWTKSTSHNNKALRVVSGSGGSSGGSVGFTSAFQNHTVSISGSDTVSISDSDTVSISGSCTGSQSIYWNTTQAWLSVNQMPSHQHDYDVPRGSSGGQYGFLDTGNSGSSGTQKVAGTGGSSYHTHAIIMQYVNGSNFDFEGSDTVSLSGSDTVSISGSDDVNLAVQYVDVIICTKG